MSFNLRCMVEIVIPCRQNHSLGLSMLCCGWLQICWLMQQLKNLVLTLRIRLQIESVSGPLPLSSHFRLSLAALSNVTFYWLLAKKRFAKIASFNFFYNICSYVCIIRLHILGTVLVKTSDHLLKSHSIFVCIQILKQFGYFYTYTFVI